MAVNMSEKMTVEFTRDEMKTMFEALKKENNRISGVLKKDIDDDLALYYRVTEHQNKRLLEKLKGYYYHE